MKHHALKTIAIIHITLIGMLLLSACSFSLPNIGGVKGAATGTPDGSVTASASPEAGEESTSPAAAEPAAGPDQPAAEMQISAQDFSDPANLPTGLILFTSTSEQPFQNQSMSPASNPNGERYLWAISTDGKRAGRVSPEGSGTALFVPGTANKKSKIIPNGFAIAGEQIETVAIPEECAGEGNPACGGFQFSPNGNMLAYFSGADSCGRTLKLYDLIEKKQAYAWEKVHWAYFFKNGSLMVSLGDCESQFAYLYSPSTGKQSGVAKVGKPSWNPTHTSVIFQIQNEPAAQAGLWGFNVETSRVFIWPTKEPVIEDTPIWLADGENFVFQHQTFTYDKASKNAVLTGPRQVIFMNATTRSQKLLGYDSRSNYHLCGAEDLPNGTEPGSPCEQTYGNWLHIQRLPFQPLHFKMTETNTPAVRCALYGLDCEGKPETLALDWQTGKQYPWEEARVPDATATPSAHRPDLDKDPFYQDPNGEFAFYLGKSGKTLWYVPRDREASLWVQDGENFIYLP